MKGPRRASAAAPGVAATWLVVAVGTVSVALGAVSSRARLGDCYARPQTRIGDGTSTLAELIPEVTRA
jgi:hypothetical protein